MSDEYAHPIGQTSKQLVDAGVEIQKQAEAARDAGDKATADRLDVEAKQHIATANTLDRADQAYGDRNS